MPEEQKPPIKFYYFNIRGKERVTFQKWFCLIMKLEFNIVIDIPTLNSDIGKLYDISLSEYDLVRDSISAGHEFMEALEEHIVFINKPMTPSDIFNMVKKDMDQIGSFDDNEKYHFNEEHLGQFTFLYVNNIEYLLSESDGYQMLNQEALKKKFCSYMEELRDTYKTTNVWISPSKMSNSRLIKDTEPSYKDLGHSSKVADLGIVLYNPYGENNNKYLNYPVEDLIVSGKTRFRTATIVTNLKGLDNITVGLIFLGECGYFKESPHPTEEEEWNNIYRLLHQLP